MQEYSEVIDGHWVNSTGIFRGIIHFNHSELNDTNFVSVFQDGLNHTMKRDCSVSKLKKMIFMAKFRYSIILYFWSKNIQTIISN